MPIFRPIAFALSKYRPPLLAEYLIVGGGGGGGQGRFGNAQGGHGGGGEVKTGSTTLAIGSHSASVGAPGAGGLLPGNTGDGQPGGASIFNGIIAAGGLGGAIGADVEWGGNGGASGNGNAGAVISGPTPGGGFGGPGGGAGGASAFGGPGPGVSSSITGSMVEYGRGGQSGSPSEHPGWGGQGSFTEPGLDGAFGLIAIRYLGPARATGGTVTTAGGYTTHVFWTSGTLTVT